MAQEQMMASFEKLKVTGKEDIKIM